MLQVEEYPLRLTAKRLKMDMSLYGKTDTWLRGIPVGHETRQKVMTDLGTTTPAVRENTHDLAHSEQRAAHDASCLDGHEMQTRIASAYGPISSRSWAGTRRARGSAPRKRPAGLGIDRRLRTGDQ